MDGLGKRMKENYENRQRLYLTRRTPVIIRVDGRAFHTLTRGISKPFDDVFMEAMKMSVWCVADEIQGCTFAYTQSDEASFLLTDYANLESEAYFDYNLSKLISITAGAMTGYFNKWYSSLGGKLPETGIAMFDSRAFNIPREEVANYFLWRAQDWHRNSVLMYCQSLFAHKAMQGKKLPELHEMLHAIGKNWTTDLTEQQKNGSWYIQLSDTQKIPSRWRSDILPQYESINAVVQEKI